MEQFLDKSSLLTISTTPLPDIPLRPGCHPDLRLVTAAGDALRLVRQTRSGSRLDRPLRGGLRFYAMADTQVEKGHFGDIQLPLPDDDLALELVDAVVGSDVVHGRRDAVVGHLGAQSLVDGTRGAELFLDHGSFCLNPPSDGQLLVSGQVQTVSLLRQRLGAGTPRRLTFLPIVLSIDGASSKRL